MKRSVAFKLIASGIGIAATAISLTASTYAFVIIGQNVYVPDFNFEIKGYEGLNISLDGKNYSQDITSQQIMDKISELSGEDFTSQRFKAVSPVQDDTYKVTYDADGKMNFQMDQVINNTHSMKAATANKDYIALDVWFKVVNSAASTTKYNLYFGEKTAVTAKTLPVTLETSFNTWKYDGTKYYEPTLHEAGTKVDQNIANAVRIAVVTDQDPTNKLKIYEVTNEYDLGGVALEGSEDPKHDPYNSMMINYYNAYFPLYPFAKEDDGKIYKATGVPFEKQAIDEEGKPKYKSIDAVDEDGNLVYVQSKNEDGSLKFEQKIENDQPVFDEENNPVLVPVYEVKKVDVPILAGIKGVHSGEAYVTQSSIYNSVLGNFDTTNTFKATIYIWLEGWDADYLIGTTAEGSKLSVDLDFGLGKI